MSIYSKSIKNLSCFQIVLQRLVHQPLPKQPNWQAQRPSQPRKNHVCLITSSAIKVANVFITLGFVMVKVTVLMVKMS